MPNRIIKDTIKSSKTVNAMTDFQFRVWLYLITHVDDYGRGIADPELLKGFLFPRLKRIRESDIGKALAELAGMGAIRLYEVDGEFLLCFPNWSSHQRIQTKISKFPAPPERSPSLTVTHGDSRLESNPESGIQNPESNPEVVGADKPPRKKFIPPTVGEVAAHCQEKGYHIDPEAFVAYYQTRNWKVGRDKMSDWKAATVTWEKNERKGGASYGNSNSAQKIKPVQKLPGRIDLGDE